MNVVERKFRAGKNSATLSVIMLIDRNILQVFSPAYLKAMIRRPHLCWHFPSETLIQFLSPGRNLSSLQSPKEIFLALCVYFPFFAYRIAFVWKQEMEIRQLIRKGKRNKIWNYCPLLYVHTNLCWFMDEIFGEKMEIKAVADLCFSVVPLRSAMSFNTRGNRSKELWG